MKCFFSSGGFPYPISGTSVVSEGLRRGSAAARLLELVGSNPAGTLILSISSVVCCQVEVSVSG